MCCRRTSGFSEAGREVLSDSQHPSRESVSPEHISSEVRNRDDPVQGGDSEPPVSADDHESDEARTARVSKLPVRPSQSEVNSHMITHLPYRSWCPHCVRGKSKGKPHHKVAQEGSQFPRLRWITCSCMSLRMKMRKRECQY